MTRTNKLFWIIFFGLCIRLFLAYAYIQYPDIPHDFQFYLGGVENLLNGEIYQIPSTHHIVYCYGPMTAAAHTIWVLLFGEGYFALKTISILADLFTILFVYLLAAKIYPKMCIEATLLYTFSYTALLNSGMLGNDDNFFVLFVLIATYFLVSGRVMWSGVAYAISIGFKNAPIIFVIPFFLYLYTSKKQTLKFLFSTAVTFTLLLSVFYLLGHEALTPYLNVHESRVGLLEPLNFIRINAGLIVNLVHYLGAGEIIPYDENPLKSAAQHPINEFINSIGGVTLIIGLILSAYLMKKKQTENREQDLLRNMCLVTIFALLFGKCFDSLYLLWMFPYLCILTSPRIDKKYWTQGISLTILSVTLLAVFYRWEADMTLFSRICLMMSIPLATMGTYFMFRTSVKEFKDKGIINDGFQLTKPLTIIMFAAVLFRQTLANHFIIIIPNETIALFAYRYVTIVIMLIGIIYLVIKLLQNDTIIRRD